MIQEGYLYIATDDRYLGEAVRSARSLRRYDEFADITLIASKEIKDPLFNRVIIRPVQNARNWFRGLGYRAEHMYQDSPYEKTFYVDTDTCFFDSCYHLFRILDHFDICAAAAPVDHYEINVDGEPLQGYYPYNLGVLLFRKNQENESLFRKWHEIYVTKILGGTRRRGESDQTAFMEALLTSKARVYALSPIYNARADFFLDLKQEVKIIHGRFPSYENMKRKINVTYKQRLWDPAKRKCLFRKKKILPKYLEYVQSF
ncbi:MAG: hypothetical protein JW893_08115 [Candidatus Omnitrophica bacterium]|nr:hypothetical protein [Candidatus Omnitrophota bacterium]